MGGGSEGNSGATSTDLLEAVLREVEREAFAGVVRGSRHREFKDHFPARDGRGHGLRAAVNVFGISCGVVVHSEDAV